MKITGRTDKGFGIGVLNAITGNEYVTIIDTTTGQIRKVKSQPVTNYNVMVLDKTFGQNSHIALINTNLSRNYTSMETIVPNSLYVANVTSLDAKIYLGKYSFTAVGAVSRKPINLKYNNGFYYDLRWEKEKGSFRYSINRVYYDSKYDPNDMGFLNRNNMVLNAASVSYLITRPFSLFLDFRNTLTIQENRRLNPDHLADVTLYYDMRARLVNQWSVSLSSRWQPNESFDYYEPRTAGLYFKRSPYYGGRVSVESNRNRSLSGRISFNTNIRQEIDNSYSTQISFDTWAKISRRLSFSSFVSNISDKNNQGFVSRSTDGKIIYFSNRNISTTEFVVNAAYIFSTKTALDLRTRYYYSGVSYNSFFTLNDLGRLTPESGYTYNDFYFNDLSTDISFIWHFSPGSRISALLRYHLYNNSQGNEGLFRSLRSISSDLGASSISVKWLYYIDYNKIKK